ncbi:hypothetical protein KSB_52640 [Ktedonobacter robiniae]|uniref:Uncharacterized protein n=2 Tax=Ktedonobacter robiniae TaxID=2778365 RepID=A0ABQ3UVB0_9CHLR|nr:hypothetical protein KSB_52640 [Ktedonobacter robiniae]
MSLPPVWLDCTVTGRGWAEASLSDGTNEWTITASYLSDGLSDLLKTVISLVEGAQEGICRWQEEPGEYRWLFSRQEEQIEIRILWFKETFSHRLNDAGRCELVLTCSLREFATKLRREFSHLLNTLGEEGYAKEWGYGFPRTDLLKLQQLLSRKKAK